MGIKFFFGDDMTDLEHTIDNWLKLCNYRITSVSTQWIDSRGNWFITVIYERRF